MKFNALSCMTAFKVERQHSYNSGNEGINDVEWGYNREGEDFREKAG
jgi:hypothetical protein